MANARNQNEGRYVPTQVTRMQVQPWIDSDFWFQRRKGRQRDLLLAIAQDCGYTALPKNPASMKALIGNHIAVFFSAGLANKFNQMVDEL